MATSVPAASGESRFSFITQFTLAFLLVVVLPIAVLSVYTFNRERNAALERAEASAELVGSAKADELNSALEKIYNDIQSILIIGTRTEAYFEAVNTGQTTRATTILNNVLDDNPSLVSIKLFNRSLTAIIEVGLEDFPTNRVSRGDLNRAINPQVSLIYEGPQGQPLLDIIYPLLDINGSIRGYFLVTQDLNRAQRNQLLGDFYGVLRQQVQVKGVPRATIVLFSANGQLVGSSRADALFVDNFSRARPIANTIEPSELVRFTPANISQGRVERYFSPILEENVIGYYESIIGTRWIVVVEYSEQQVTSQTNVLATIFVLAVAVLLANLVVYILGYLRIFPPIQKLIYYMNTYSIGQDRLISPSLRADEVGSLHNSFVRMSNYLATQFSSQNQQIQALSQRIQLLNEFSRALTVANIDYILDEIVRAIREAVSSIDHAQVFLVDATNQKAVLKASTGELGRRLLVQGHEQSLHSGGIVANTILLGEAQLINDVTDPTEYNMPEIFTETRSVALIPIKAAEQVWGLLDLHSHQPNIFTSEDLSFYASVAAIIGAVMAQKHTVETASTTPLEKLLSSKQSVVESVVGVAGTIPTDQSWTPLQRQAMTTKHLALEKRDDKVWFALPILLRDEVLGAIEWVVAESQFNPYLTQTAQELVNRLAIAVDNARLFEQTRRIVNREQRINEITQKITTHNEVQQILQVAVRELGQALGSGNTYIKLKIDAEDLE
jgi:GAF domain-containing protein